MSPEVSSDPKLTIPLSAWVTDEVAYSIRLSAALNRRTISAEIRHALHEYLKNDNRPGDNQGDCQDTGGGAGHEPR